MRVVVLPALQHCHGRHTEQVKPLTLIFNLTLYVTLTLIDNPNRNPDSNTHAHSRPDVHAHAHTHRHARTPLTGTVKAITCTMTRYAALLP